MARLARLLRELHGSARATGTAENLCRRVARWLAAIADRLRVAGNTVWLHVLCDYIWTEHVGVTVHDHFGVYGNWLSQETGHALCNAYLLSNLQEIVELEKAPDGWMPVYSGCCCRPTP